jgi:hypothetical protein
MAAINSELTLGIRARNYTTRALREVQKDMRFLGRTSLSATRQMTSAFGNMATRIRRHLFSLKSAFAVLGLGLLGRSFVKVASEMEVFRVQLISVLGGIKKADVALREIVTFAARTPFEIPKIVEARIALESVGIAGMKALETVGETAAAMGRDIVEVATALQSMLAQVLRRYGIEVRRTADTATFTWKNHMGEMVSKTVTGGMEVIRATLLAIWNEKYKGGMDRFRATWEGLISNLMDWWTIFRVNVMEAGDPSIWDYLKGSAKALLEHINELAEKGTLDEWAKKISANIVSIFKRTLLGVAKIIDYIGPMVKKAWDELKTTWKEFRSLPKWFQELGLVGVFFFGKAGAAGLYGLIKAIEFGKTVGDALNEYVKSIEQRGLAETFKDIFKSGAEEVRVLGEEMKALPDLPPTKSAQEKAKEFIKMLETWGKKLKDAGSETNNLTNSTNKMTASAKEASAEFKVLSEKMADYFRTPIEKLGHQRDEMLKIAKDSAKLRLQIEEWYAQERLKLIRKALEAEVKTDKEREEKHKKTLEKLQRDNLAYWIRVIQNAENGTEKIEDAWYEVRRIVEEQNVGMTRGFKIGWSDALTHFKTVGHRMYELGRDTAQNLHQTFSDYFFDAMMGNIRSLKDAWKSFTDYLKNAFLRALADILASQAIRALTNWIGGLSNIQIGFGGGGGLFGGGGGLLGTISNVFNLVKGVTNLFGGGGGGGWGGLLGGIFGGGGGGGGIFGGLFGGGGAAATAAPSAYGAYGGYQTITNPALRAYAGIGQGGGIWATLAPYLLAAGLGYLGGGILGQYIGPSWFGTSGQYGGYGGAIGAAGGYAGGTALGAATGWAGLGPIGAIIGGLLGTIVGSAIGPEVQKTSSRATYSITAEELLSGAIGRATVGIKSTHGYDWAANAAYTIAGRINDVLIPTMVKYRDLLGILPNAKEAAELFGTFTLHAPARSGMRSAGLTNWQNELMGDIPSQVETWFKGGLFRAASKWPDLYGSDPERWLGGERYRTGLMGWSETGERVPYSGYFQQGGIVPRTGMAFVHKGEEIVPKEKREDRPTIQNNFTINVSAIDASDFKRKIHRDIIPELEDKIKRFAHIRYTIKDI